MNVSVPSMLNISKEGVPHQMDAESDGWIGVHLKEPYLEASVLLVLLSSQVEEQAIEVKGGTFWATP
jgi:hypothetical protein